jgi:hypothetical protein
MTIEWHYGVERDLDILSVTGYLGPDAVHRFAGAIGWVLARGTGPVILDLADLRAWSTEGQRAVTEAACRLAAHGRSLELSAIPVGAPFPEGEGPDVPVHHDLSAAIAAHTTRRPAMAGRRGGVTAGPAGH